MRARATTGMLAIALLAGCSEAPPSVYDVPIRSSGEIVASLRAACEDSLDRSRPMLVEFSAAWCSDCQTLHRMKQRRVLERELSSWPKVVINVGMFDRHRELLEAFGVEAIAHWVVLSPRDCAPPAASWRRLAERTLEPASGPERGLSAAEIAEWLAAIRAAS